MEEATFRPGNFLVLPPGWHMLDLGAEQERTALHFPSIRNHQGQNETACGGEWVGTTLASGGLGLGGHFAFSPPSYLLWHQRLNLFFECDRRKLGNQTQKQRNYCGRLSLKYI